MKPILTFIIAALLALTVRSAAKDPVPQKVRIVGIVIQKLDLGLLIECVNLGTVGAKKAQGFILLTGHPDESKAFDGIGVKCTALESGTYEYEAVTGGGRTIRTYSFVSK